MLNLIKNAAIATVFSVAEVDARRHLDNDIEHRRNAVELDSSYTEATGDVHSPLVEGTDCTPMCLFEDKYNRYCWKFQSPMLQMGWEWQQTKGDRYWQMQFKPYVKPMFYF
jgi:hypothetical protein